MSKFVAIKRRTKDAKPPSSSTLRHNQRIGKEPSYLLPEHLRKKNYHLIRTPKPVPVFNSWKKENEKRYEEKRGRKLRSDASRMESLLIILSEEQVELCNPDDIWKKSLEFKQWFEERYLTRVRSVDWHQDEGHADKEIIETRNNHIHFIYDNVNDLGQMVRRLFSKGDMIKMQDAAAEIFGPLGFVRGEDTTKKSRTDRPKRGHGQEKYRAMKKAEAEFERRLQQAISEQKARILEKYQEKLRELKTNAEEMLREKIRTIRELREVAYGHRIGVNPDTMEHEKYPVAYRDILIEERSRSVKLEEEIEDLWKEVNGLRDWKDKASGVISKLYDKRHPKKADRSSGIRSTLNHEGNAPAAPAPRLTRR